MTRDSSLFPDEFVNIHLSTRENSAGGGGCTRLCQVVPSAAIQSGVQGRLLGD